MKRASRLSGAVAAVALAIAAMAFFSEPLLFPQAQSRVTQCSQTASATTARSSQAAAASREPLNPAAGPANAPMTAAQGAAILRELRAIRLLLQNGAAARLGARQPPGPHNVKIPVGSDWHELGRASAPLTMIEFTDLQCPFCRRFETTTFAEIKKDYIDTGKLRFVARDLPLPMHRYALGAAEAARCAGDQGKFWQFRDAVLDDQSPPAPDNLLKHARELGLNLKEFQTCMDGAKYKQRIQADQDDAAAAGIHGTPAFVIGRVDGRWIDGLAMQGARSFAFFQQMIDGMLKGSRSATARMNSAENGDPARAPGAGNR